MWTVIRTIVTLVATIVTAVVAFLSYTNAVEEQHRRKTATVEVSADSGEPATTTVVVTAARAHDRQLARELQPARGPEHTTNVVQPHDVEHVAVDPLRALFSRQWRLPLSGRTVALRSVDPGDTTGTTFIVDDISEPYVQHLGYGFIRGREVRIHLRVPKHVATGEYVFRDATLNLRLSKDGGELVGEFHGEDAAERGPVLWLATSIATAASAENADN